MTNYTTHPAADTFPMLSDEELQALATDIKENGLIHPLVVKGTTLIDGRNRLAACKIAKVEPDVVEFEGDDDSIVGYIISTNLQQRHLTQGQRALVAARLIEVRSTREVSSIVGVPQSTVTDARTILEYAPNLVNEVLDPDPDPADRVTFARALLVAKENSGRGKKSVSQNKEMTKLKRWVRSNDPGIADQAAADNISWVEAKAMILDERAAYDARIARRVGYLKDMLVGLVTLQFVIDNVDSDSEHYAEVKDILDVLDKKERAAVRRAAITWKENG